MPDYRSCVEEELARNAHHARGLARDRRHRAVVPDPDHDVVGNPSPALGDPLQLAGRARCRVEVVPALDMEELLYTTAELAHEGKVRHWREAFESGTVRATGPPEILRLISSVVEKQEERTRTRRLKTRYGG